MAHTHLGLETLPAITLVLHRKYVLYFLLIGKANIRDSVVVYMVNLHASNSLQFRNTFDQRCPYCYTHSTS